MDSVDVKALQTRATMPLVFTESLSYYQCIYMLYTKINEMIDVLNKCEEFVDSMVNYLEINYNIAEEYRDTINTNKVSSITRGSVTGFLQLVSAFNFQNSAESKNVLVFFPVNGNSSVIEFPQGFTAKVSYMFNDILMEETITADEESKLIVTTGNLIVVTCGTYTSSGVTPLAEMSSEIYDVSKATEIHPYAFGWNDIKVNVTDGSTSVYFDYGNSRVNVPVVDGSASTVSSVLQWLPSIYTSNNPNLHAIIQPWGDPVLYLPDFMAFTFNANDQLGEITYFTYTGLVTVDVSKGLQVNHPKVYLTYYDEKNKQFKVKHYNSRMVTLRTRSNQVPQE